MPITTTDQYWELIRAARRQLADDLADVTRPQWRTRSLCGEWDIEQVLAHLTAAARVGQWRWIRSIVGSGFRPAVHNARRLREQLGDTPAGTYARFRESIELRIAPSKDLAAYLGEVLVHGEDIRRPLGIDAPPSTDAVTAVLDFYVSRDFTVPSRRTSRGLGLQATDAPFASGEGPEVTGPARALMMTLAGRPQYLDQLGGPGAVILRERLSR
ncbi:maleylpyruvate isomerase family mycothiol-dependent enzyme [Enemella evansiae]|uniref:maleylpyruvate isomerase family mycothiol-dependent enzyme n=1 Tax=Enemella evansiae TaxID=2016499 RepID=UPI000B97B9B0|nr:maleylpyruvate isomerase family mycothiol-dependent enzyme [Enemella evansiae]OYN99807.1 hypothetical protein CGZ97_19825 [Enemella evansiae]